MGIDVAAFVRLGKDLLESAAPVVLSDAEVYRASGMTPDGRHLSYPGYEASPPEPDLALKGVWEDADNLSRKDGMRESRYDGALFFLEPAEVKRSDKVIVKRKDPSGKVTEILDREVEEIDYGIRLSDGTPAYCRLLFKKSG